MIRLTSISFFSVCLFIAQICAQASAQPCYSEEELLAINHKIDRWASETCATLHESDIQLILNTVCLFYHLAKTDALTRTHLDASLHSFCSLRQMILNYKNDGSPLHLIDHLHKTLDASTYRTPIYNQWKTCTLFLETATNRALYTSVDSLQRHLADEVKAYFAKHDAEINNTLSATHALLHKTAQQICLITQDVQEVIDTTHAYKGNEEIKADLILNNACLIEDLGWNMLKAAVCLSGHVTSAQNLTYFLFSRYYRALYQAAVNRSLSDKYFMVMFDETTLLPQELRTNHLPLPSNLL